MKKIISNIVSAAVMVIVSTAPVFAQNNLGVVCCGCPLVSDRPTMDLAIYADASGNLGLDGNILQSLVLDCKTTWILSKKIYVPAGLSITIKPGTLIRATDVSDAAALIITKGGKIFAQGHPLGGPIVFTAADDPMDGKYCEQGKWGGVVLLGKACNNLTAANVSGSGFGISPGIGFIEGFLSIEARNQYGMAPGMCDDNDNSGIMSYVSIRHAGDIVGPSNELNGLTLASVGRGTWLDHIEVLYNLDDGIEFFGGTVDLNYAIVMYCADDSFDWDQGWRGRGQYWASVHSNIAQQAGDNGLEGDNDDEATGAAPFSNPTISNATFLGNGGEAAIRAKEATRGKILNSFFVNFGAGFSMSNITLGNQDDVYKKWKDNFFVVKSCTFFPAPNSLLITGTAVATSPAADSAKFFNQDLNVGTNTVPPPADTLHSLPCGHFAADKFNLVPNPILGNTVILPLDGFFKPVNYRGAFKSGEKP